MRVAVERAYTGGILLYCRIGGVLRLVDLARGLRRLIDPFDFGRSCFFLGDALASLFARNLGSPSLAGLQLDLVLQLALSLAEALSIVSFFRPGPLVERWRSPLESDEFVPVVEVLARAGSADLSVRVGSSSGWW
jgi:hypothetical protein